MFDKQTEYFEQDGSEREVERRSTYRTAGGARLVLALDSLAALGAGGVVGEVYWLHCVLEKGYWSLD